MQQPEQGTLRINFTPAQLLQKTFAAYSYSDTGKYVFSVSNRNNSYACDQTHRIRIYAREKNWSPNIYNVQALFLIL